MAKIAFIADTHFGVRNDSPLFVDHFLSFFEDQFFPYLTEHNIKSVIHLGDLVDRRKYINFYTLSETKKRFIENIKKNNINFHCIIGNHDTFFKNTNSLNSVSELFGGYDINIYENPQIANIEGFDFGIVPWINKENESECMDFMSTAKTDIMLGHFELNGYEIMRGVKFEEGMNPKVLSRYDAVYSGHFHCKQTLGNIHYLGTPYQITFTDLYEKPGFYVFDTETRNMEFVENTKKLFYSIRYDDKEYDMLSIDFKKYKNCFIKIIIVKKINNKMFDDFVALLNSAEIYELSIAENFNTDEESKSADIDTTKDTISIINDEIDQMQNVPNKNKLKSIIHGLYLESLSQ